MNKNYLNLLSIALLAFGLISCGGEKKEKSEAKSSPVAEAKPVASGDALLKKGETVYKSYCFACHMNEGQGVPNLNPPLTRTKYTLGDKKEMAKIVIQGLEGEIEVLGTKYNNVMTPFGFLSDEEVAGVVTYVRQSFGNDADAISVEEVAAVRASLN